MADVAHQHQVAVPDLSSHPLQQIEDNVALRRKLEQWEKEEDIVRQRIENKESSRSNTQNEIYQLFALYFVFQGVVLSALFQAAGGSSNSSNSLCKLWWLPFSLSLVTSIATITATFHKLFKHGKLQHAVEQEKKFAKAIFNLIEDIRLHGRAYDIDELPQNSRSSTSEASFFDCIFHKSLRAYTVCVTLVLTVFSGILLAACKLVLCNH